MADAARAIYGATLDEARKSAFIRDFSAYRLDEILGAATPAQSCFRCKGVWAPGPSVDAIIRLHPKPNAPAPTAEEPKKRRLGDWLSAWLDG